ncbi:hypothetical protein HGA64_01105 [Candidatus Falkowbacteria bacterium]|nr:hypothetical protein [Candidatus Falkowbacteria bacterium]
MKSKIKELMAKIDQLNNALQKEHARLAEKYGFSINKQRIIFIEKFRARNKNWRIPTWQYVVPHSLRHLLSMPFIYMMIIPTVILDLFISIYNWTALPLYRIPPVKRSEYIIYDRQFLDYLNVIQKINCIYCSYVNGLFAFAGEIGARTERYWCPVKAAKRVKARHGWYSDFADYGNPEEWNEKFNDHEAFKKVA